MKPLPVCSLLLLTLALAAPAKADTITDSNLQFTASVTGTTATLQIQCLKAAVCGNWYIGDVSLKGFTITSPRLGTAPTGYTLKSGDCNRKRRGKAVCWDAPATLDTLGDGMNLFTANGSEGSLSEVLHVQATFYDNPAGYGTHGDKVFAVSRDLRSLAPVPEPASILLLGTGLLSLGAFLRRRAEHG